jgi:hypothetical protein
MSETPEGAGGRRLREVGRTPPREKCLSTYKLFLLFEQRTLLAARSLMYSQPIEHIDATKSNATPRFSRFGTLTQCMKRTRKQLRHVKKLPFRVYKLARNTARFALRLPIEGGASMLLT